MDATPPQMTSLKSPPADENLESGGLAGLIRRHPIRAFLAWFFTVGQAIALIPVVIADLPTEPFIIASTFVGLLLPTLVITRIVDGPDGLRALWERALRVGVHARWFAFSVIGVPLVAAAITAAFVGMPASVTGSTVASALTFGYIVSLVVVFVTVNWWEEIAWMGFVQARLQQAHGAMRSSVVTGIVFAFGHITLVVGEGATGALTLMALLIAVSIPFRALQAWVYNRTGSLFVVGLVHAAGNAVALGSIMGDGMLIRLYGDSSLSGLVFPILAVMGLVAIAATRGRLGQPMTRT